jgi:hypothetical protein
MNQVRIENENAQSRPSDASARGDTPVRSLDELARMPDRDLARLYARAAMPDRMRRLDGDLVGRMLAVRGTGRAVLRALASIAATSGFPWEGKSFEATGDERGTGINRVRLGGGGRHRLFPFRTSFGPSKVDGRPAVLLDYALPDNPAVIRAIHDEVREVSPGLYLGPACWKKADGSAPIVLWFGLDARGVERTERSVRPS